MEMICAGHDLHHKIRRQAVVFPRDHEHDQTRPSYVVEVVVAVAAHKTIFFFCSCHFQLIFLSLSYSNRMESICKKLIEEQERTSGLLDARNGDGMTALNLCFQLSDKQKRVGSAEVITILMAHGAKVFIPDNKFKFPFNHCQDSTYRRLLASLAVSEVIDLLTRRVLSNEEGTILLKYVLTFDPYLGKTEDEILAMFKKEESAHEDTEGEHANQKTEEKSMESSTTDEEVIYSSGSSSCTLPSDIQLGSRSTYLTSDMASLVVEEVE
jgi:hypothetical protein